MNVAWGALALLAWVVQYGFYVPLVLIGRAMKFALSFGLVGLLLLFIPIVGWAILIVWFLSRRSQRQHAELLAAVTGTTPAMKTNIWRPWLVDRVTAEAPTATDAGH